jgi:hypothetical protein
MDNGYGYVICKICGHDIKYFPSDIFVGDDGEFYVHCEHCMNDILIKN